MAAFAELRALFNDSALRNRVTAAVVIAAQAEMVVNPGSINGRAWALKVLNSPKQWGETMFMAVLAANSGATVANIKTSSDASLLTNVNDIRADLINAEAGV